MKCIILCTVRNEFYVKDLTYDVPLFKPHLCSLHDLVDTSHITQRRPVRMQSLRRGADPPHDMNYCISQTCFSAPRITTKNRKTVRVT